MNKFVEGMQSIVRMVATPLRFFAVVIVALLTSVIMLAWQSTLPPDMTFHLIIFILIMLATVIILIMVLIVFFPRKLVFDQEAHLMVMREQLGDNEFLPVQFLPNKKAIGTKN